MPICLKNHKTHGVISNLYSKKLYFYLVVTKNIVLFKFNCIKNSLSDEFKIIRTVFNEIHFRKISVDRLISM